MREAAGRGLREGEIVARALESDHEAQQGSREFIA